MEVKPTRAIRKRTLPSSIFSIQKKAWLAKVIPKDKMCSLLPNKLERNVSRIQALQYDCQ